MKVRPSVKSMYEYCKVTCRKGRVMVICPASLEHEQRQG